MVVVDMYGRHPLQINCGHDTVRPNVPVDQYLHTLEAAEVRRRYPRFHGVCPDCGQLVIVYGSAAHYIAGDW